MSTLNPPIALEKPDNQARVDYIQDYASGNVDSNTNRITPFVLTLSPFLSGPDFNYPPEFYENTELLWNDRGVQQTFDRSNEYQLIDCAK